MRPHCTNRKVPDLINNKDDYNVSIGTLYYVCLPQNFNFRYNENYLYGEKQSAMFDLLQSKDALPWNEPFLLPGESINIYFKPILR